MDRTAHASSSSAPRLPDLPSPLAPQLAAWHRGDHLDLLGGLRLLTDPTPPRLGLPGASEGPLDRSALAAALAEANRGYGHPRAEALAARLADPEVRVVISGQQPGLFGGPLYSLLKMLGAVLWAEALEADGTPAIPLFWVATEDHDFAEVATSHFWLREPVGLQLPDDGQDGRPVGQRPLGPAIDGLIDRLREDFGWGSFPAMVEDLQHCYRADVDFGRAFMTYSCRLLGERAPLLVDSALAAVKRAQQPWLRRLIEDRAPIDRSLLAHTEKIESAGFEPQVHLAPGAAPLLVVEDGVRRRVLWQGDDHYSLRGDDQIRPVRDLLEQLDADPAAVTPNVLARPVLQDALFGTGLQVLGPGELSYFAQTVPLYEHLGVEPPHLVLRPQALLLDARQAEHFEQLSVPVALLLADDAAVDQALAAAADAPTIESARGSIAHALEALQGEALALDATLARPWEKTRDQILGALDRFGDRIVRAAAQRDSVRRGRLDALRSWSAPHGTLNERRLSTAYFQGRFGPGLVPQLLERLNRRPAAIQLLALEEENHGN